jgi:Animal haem peroxidase
VLNSHTDAVMHAEVQALHHAAKIRPDRHPVSSSLTALMKHGGLYTLLDTDITSARLGALMGTSRSVSPNFVPALQAAAASFFTRLVPSAPYAIPSSLMSHICLPHEGAVYTSADNEKDHPASYESPDIPAAFTFVGQFIDHDLTMNAVDLFLPQQDPVVFPGFGPIASPIQNGSSPLIDLDSVYGPRAHLASPDPALFDGGKFRLAYFGGLHYDLVRDNDGAIIADNRNDENQMILQIHLLVERMHNKFFDELSHIADPQARFDEARKQTIYNWQYMVLHDYLPRIIQPDVLVEQLGEIKKPDFGNFKYKPLRDLSTGKLVVNLPHEFAIAFRFGHSQLRRAYKLNSKYPFSVLFNNSLAGSGPNNTIFDDLRGGQPLSEKNLIDWAVFLPDQNPVKSNRIDGKVTAPIFDLPESAIPDDIKYIGNLPHRNLIRSRQVGLCSGEVLAEFYGVTPFRPDQIEPDADRRALYMRNEAVMDSGKQVFATPLWYYILREAELSNGSGPNRSKLGPLGSRLVGEVLLGAVAWGTYSILNDTAWTTTIPGPAKDHLRNIVRWVNGLENY